MLSVSEYVSRTSSPDNAASCEAKKARLNGAAGGVPNIDGMAAPLSVNRIEKAFGRSVVSVSPARKVSESARRSLSVAVTEEVFGLKR